MQTSIVINETSCLECPVGEVPDRATLSTCVPIPPVSMSWDSPWALIPAGFSLLGLGSTIFVVAVFLKFSNTPVVCRPLSLHKIFLDHGLRSRVVLLYDSRHSHVLHPDLLPRLPAIHPQLCSNSCPDGIVHVGHLRGYHHQDQ